MLWRRSQNVKTIARKLYDAMVMQARHPVFYAEWGVPDSLDGRFSMVILHAFILLRAVKDQLQAIKEREETSDEGRLRDLGQAFYDTMFLDFDRCLREMGVGDLGVSRRIKDMVQAFHGRLQAFDNLLQKPVGDAERLALLKSDIWGGSNSASAPLWLDLYIDEAIASIKDFSVNHFLQGHCGWPVPKAKG